MKLGELSRISTVRLLPVYGVLFVVWSVLLIGWVQYDTKRYLSGVIDEILKQRVHFLSHIDRARLPDAMEQTQAIEVRGVMLYGLFDRDGRKITGNIESIPKGFVLDGVVHVVPGGLQQQGAKQPANARGLGMQLENGEKLLLLRTTGVLDQVNSIIYRSLFWGLTLTVIPGVIGGLWLASGPLRRIRTLETAAQPIMHGDLHQRLPVSERRDELDMLAGIVNSMLEEIERLMSEVKGVCDAIAHDLRTPLTRLRSQLHRMHREAANNSAHEATIGQAIQDVDSLLDRFRALLRISELEDMHRRAGFTEVHLAGTLDHVREIYAPLAEDKHIAFTAEMAPNIPTVRGDPQLLLEAVSNIVDNAIKFTPAGGSIHLRLLPDVEAGVRIDVIDSGPGIQTAEREAVLQRFYRGTCSSKDVSGSGLGLSIVAAIVKLHGFRLQIVDNPAGGAWLSLLCGPARTVAT